MAPNVTSLQVTGVGVGVGTGVGTGVGVGDGLGVGAGVGLGVAAPVVVTSLNTGYNLSNSTDTTSGSCKLNPLILLILYCWSLIVILSFNLISLYSSGVKYKSNVTFLLSFQYNPAI